MKRRGQTCEDCGKKLKGREGSLSLIDWKNRCPECAKKFNEKTQEKGGKDGKQDDIVWGDNKKVP